MGGGTPVKGSDDTEIFARTALAKHTLVYQPTALIFHYHRDTLVDLKKQLHGYAVGTVASYAALISREPKLLLAMLRLIPTAIKDPYRKEIVRTEKVLPASLRRVQWRGRLEGVPAYIRSVRKQRAMSHSQLLSRLVTSSAHSSLVVNVTLAGRNPSALAETVMCPA